MKQKSHVRPIVYVMISVFLIIGYAYLTSSLTINGSTLLKKTTWDVHFENVQVKDGSVTGEQVIDEPEIDSEQTTVTFHVNLKKPGDYYEFTVDAVNAGTIDAMINTYTEFDLTTDQLKYLETSVTYEDGEEIQEKQQLLAGDTAVYKIKVAYKLDLEADDLPSNPEQLDLEFTVEYVQKDDTAIQRRDEKTLYNVLRQESKNNGVALKYTGNHQDSMDSSMSTKDIYHWYAADVDDASLVRNKYNVIFADHCWQMIRTTDTGGVKMIYNGEPENDMCLSSRGDHVGYNSISTQTLSTAYYYGTSYSYDNNVFSLDGVVTTGTINIGEYTCRSTSRNGTCDSIYYVVNNTSGSYYFLLVLSNNSHYSQFGQLRFNLPDSPAHSGYMYNTVYGFNYKYTTSNESMLSSSSLGTSYWYADSYTWDSPETGKYNLSNPYQVSSQEDYSSLVGKYTFLNSSQDYAGTYLYYIAAVNGSTFYYITFYSGNDLSYYNRAYTFGDSYIDNGDGTYTINNPGSFERKDWFSYYSNFKNKYFCKDTLNNTCSALYYSTSSSTSSYMYYESLVNDYKYSNNFEYRIDEADGKYKYFLTGDIVHFWDSLNNTNKALTNSAHYTCLNTIGKCTTISYIFENAGDRYYTFDFAGGKSIDDAFDEMLSNDDVNLIDSTIKSGIDAWYKNNLTDYSNYIEDTIFCNDRTISFFDTTAWYSESRLPSISLGTAVGVECINETDKFSTANNKARLTYPIGLITKKEMELLGNKYIFETGKNYWLGNAVGYSRGGSSVGSIDWTGYLGSYTTNSPNRGVRPSISLKPGTLYSSGDGSMENPYVIDTN